jgi:hypothetical protein
MFAGFLRSSMASGYFSIGASGTYGIWDMGHE